MQGLTQHFEQMTMRNTVNPMDMGHIPDEATAEVSQISLNHDEISMELYSGHIFPACELVPTADRHHGTRLQIRAIGVQFKLDAKSGSCLFCSAHWQATEEAIFLTMLLEEDPSCACVRLLIQLDI